MRKLIILSSLIFFSFAAQAADINKGKQSALSCQSCHGATGISTNPLYPNLAGQKSAYLVKQMRDFKTGKRQDPIMSAMVKSLSEDDLSNIAEYFTSLSAQ